MRRVMSAHACAVVSISSGVVLPVGAVVPPKGLQQQSDLQSEPVSQLQEGLLQQPGVIPSDRRCYCKDTTAISALTHPSGL